MKPEVWGPPSWVFLHSITMNYPSKPSSDDKKKIYKFFDALKYVLPCDSCSKNLQRHIKKRPLSDRVLRSRNTLMRWLIDIRNDINKENKKPVIPVADAIKKLEDMYKET
jgi:hypothetical protein